MRAAEWEFLQALVNRQIGRLLYAQQVLANVHEALDRRGRSPLEEDYIDRDVTGAEIVGPSVRSFDGVSVSTWRLHRRGKGARDIKGADIPYEIEGKKFVLIQTKIPRNARVAADHAQLAELRNACPVPCPPTPQTFSGCASWHCVAESLDEYFYHQACQAEALFNGAGSKGLSTFKGGLGRQSFESLFAECQVGAQVDAGAILHALGSSLSRGHALFFVFQSGQWTPAS